MWAQVVSKLSQRRGEGGGDKKWVNPGFKACVWFMDHKLHFQHNVYQRERGDNGLFVYYTSPQSFLACWLNNFGDFSEF